MIKFNKSIHFPKFFNFGNEGEQPNNGFITPSHSKIAYRLSLVAALILMLAMSLLHGISGDELDMNAYGKAILNYFLTFGEDSTALNMPAQFDRDGVLKYYGGFFDLLCAILNKISPLEEFTTRHLFNAFVGFLGIYFASQIIKKLSSEAWATLGVWLMFLSPFFLGHAMNNPKDIPFATAYIISIYFMIQLFERIQTKLTWKDYAWLILSIGLAINIRVGGLLLIPYLGVYAFLIWFIKFERNKESIIKLLKPVLITSVLTYFAGSMCWPFGLQNPLLNPIEALGKMSKFNIVVRQIFQGNRVLSDHLPIGYLPISFGITNTMAVLIGLCFMFIFIYRIRTHTQFSTILFILFTVLFPLCYIIITQANVYHAWRHILFIFPSVIILSALGWQWFIRFTQQFNLQTVGLGILGFALLEPLYFIATTMPNTVTYHNTMAGGVRGAYGQYEMDYYYNSLKETCDWFLEHEYPLRSKTDTFYMASNASHLVSHYFKNYPNIVVDYTRFLERNQKDWDYSIMHIALIPKAFIQQKKWLPPSVLYQSKVQDMPLNALYKRPSYHDVRAYNYIQTQQLDSAISYFNYYLEKDPDNTCILNATAKLLLQTAQMDSAILFAKRSYAIDSSDPDTKLIYGITLIEQKKLVEAEQLFQAVIQEFPNDKETYFYLGLVQKDLGKIEEALNNLDMSAHSEQYRPSALKLMGDIYMEKNMQEEAVKLYKAGGFLK